MKKKTRDFLDSVRVAKNTWIGVFAIKVKKNVSQIDNIYNTTIS